MKATDLLHSSTFRLAISYMALFTGSVLLLLVFIYWSTVAFMAQQTDISIKTEMSWLLELYNEKGERSLILAVDERVRGRERAAAVYAVTSPGKKVLAGNLLGLPDAQPGAWLNFSYGDSSDSGQVLQIRGLSNKLDNYSLFVGRDIRENIVLQQLIVRTLLWGLAFMVVLGLLGGILLSRRVLRHIEHINNTTREIMEGDLSRRIPTNGSGDDFDQLATNLNSMLDEIARLMSGIRNVSNSVAHDLRTPLTRLRNQLETLHDDIGNDSQHSQQVEQSISDADQLLSTFSGLLRIARIEAGGLKANIKQVSLTALVEDAMELYEAVAEVKKIRINTEIKDEVTVLADRDMLFQAVTNLLDNAIKYTQAGGKVTLQAAQIEQVVEIVVADNGPGVPAFEYDRIVQRFYRMDKSRNTSGNGLGLSLVEAVMNMHNGSLTFSDNKPGLKAAMQFKPESSAHIK